jgi:SAM-dependent methyltransferase
MDEIDECLQGKRLYGDDFSPRQIAEWHADEKEAYAGLGVGDAGNYRYRYHALNMNHAYRHLPDRTFEHVPGFGSAYGDELRPLIARVGQVTIVDPSDAFAAGSALGVPTHYAKPAVDGAIPLADRTFDLITWLGVLRYIPNVSFVVRELARTLKPGGWMVLREPITSMGDWRQPRRGLTRRERGIPLPILGAIVHDAGLAIRHQSLCVVSLSSRLMGLLRPDVYNRRVATWLDGLLCSAFAWNLRYHARSIVKRLRPTSVFPVLRKSPAPMAS